MSIDDIKHSPRRRTKKLLFAFLIFIGVVGCALLTIGALGLRDYLLATEKDVSAPTQEVITSVTDHPSEKKPDQDASYTVPAGQPRRLEIPSIGVSSFIQRVGIEKSGAMATPNNIYFTGWYVNNPIPGEKGVSILNGHVGGRYNPGIFKDLKALKENDEIMVEMGDLSVRKFSVVSVNAYAVSDAGKPLFNDDPSIDKELHLITCDGEYDNAAQSYDKRVIVVAKYVR